jgi:diaminohydroxyphosphoribosylaminopyrimidine deaminase/5-amino-6-(5-phosphoribosylamino)uracil reductase
MALEEAGASARGATAYVTLEPCAHPSARGPNCTDSLIAAGIARVVCARRDPDPRTNGHGFTRLADAGVRITQDVLAEEARAAMAGWWSRMTRQRAFVTLKLATSLDGCIAMADGSSRWLTGERARAHTHLLRARSDAILVGGGTLRADAPRLDVRLPGLESRSPACLLLSRDAVGTPADWHHVASPIDAVRREGVGDLLVEGGAETAAAFLAADLVDRLFLYRAPILVGTGRHALGDIGLSSLAQAHDRWSLRDSRMLGKDRLEVYERR